METHILALPAGYRIESYEIQAVLGKGGFGITYVALDLQLGKRVAIKELLPDTIATRVEGSTVVPQSTSLQNDWDWARESFQKEAKVLARFSHPAIVGVHRIIEANGTAYMVMDYVEGETYEARLRRIGHEPDQASLMAVIGPLLDGLSEVHATGLLHRDIKPENILINRRGQPVLIDFGTARSAVGATMTMTMLGTPGYMPIEQSQTKGKKGPWTDIYAIGVMMCRAITGEKPPSATDRIMEDEFQWLSYRQIPGYSEQFLQAVDWALRVRPEERPQSISDWMPHLLSAGSATSSPPHTPVEESIPETFAPEESSPEIYSTQEPPPIVDPLPPPPKRKGKSVRIAMVVSVAIFVLILALSPFLVPKVEKNGAAQRPSLQGNATSAVEGAAPSAPTYAPDAKKATKESPYENSLGMKFVPVPGTDVLFSIWDTRVRDFATFVEATNYDARPPNFSQTNDHPVANVNWEDAKAFCKWLTAKERGEGNISKDQEYRLPTDAEWSVAVGLPTEIGNAPWEKMEKGKVKGVYPWGTQWPPPMGAGNYDPSLGVDSYENTSPVGSFYANRFGLYDMGGNVSQWCEDLYSVAGYARVLRGGSWGSGSPTVLVSSWRGNDFTRYGYFGFRCVLGGGSSLSDSEKQAHSARIESEKMAQEQQRLGEEAEATRAETARVEAARVEAVKKAEEKARMAREAVEAAKKATKEAPFENSLGMKFVPVPGTNVLFSIWDTRVKDYAAFVAATGYNATLEWKATRFEQTPNNPVVNVTWEDARAFCFWLTAKERGEGKIAASQEYQLPTDAEWSVAVGLPPESGRTPEDKDSKVQGVYPWGTQWPPPNGVGNYNPSLGVDSYEHTSPVGSFPANQFGLYDMGGNVYQWCDDWYSATHQFRVARGGAWVHGNPKRLLSSYRGFDYPTPFGHCLGFRCVLASSR